MPYLDGQKYYVVNEKLKVEEDICHEFKGKVIYYYYVFTNLLSILLCKVKGVPLPL